MNDRSRILRGSARAVTGLFVVAAAATAVVLLGSVTLPSESRAPEPIVVDTTQDAHRMLACAGSFSVLGVDPDRPGAAIPVGAPAVAVAGTSTGTNTLTRAEGGDGLPAIYAAPVSDPLAAAQAQSVTAENVRGVTASACAEPLNEQWLLGGGSTVGMSTTLSLANPGAVPATVLVTVFDEDGPVESLKSAGVLVPPGTEQTVSVNGYAPDRGMLGVRVVSTGAPVTATLGVAHSQGLEPFAAAVVTRQVAPERTLVIPGVANESDHKHGPSDSGEGDELPVVLRVLAPEGAGSVSARAVDASGRSTDLGSLDVVEGSVAELRVAAWPADANAVIIDADVPVIASVMGSASKGDASDYDWFVPAPSLAPGETSAAPVVLGGRLILVNPGAETAEVEIRSTSGEGKPRTVKVPAGAATSVAAPEDALVKSTQPLHAGVRYLNGGDLAGYPVLAPDPRDGELTVFTR